MTVYIFDLELGARRRPWAKMVARPLADVLWRDHAFCRESGAACEPDSIFIIHYSSINQDQWTDQQNWLDHHGNVALIISGGALATANSWVEPSRNSHIYFRKSEVVTDIPDHLFKQCFARFRANLALRERPEWNLVEPRAPAALACLYFLLLDENGQSVWANLPRDYWEKAGLEFHHFDGQDIDPDSWIYPELVDWQENRPAIERLLKKKQQLFSGFLCEQNPFTSFHRVRQRLCHNWKKGLGLRELSWFQTFCRNYNPDSEHYQREWEDIHKWLKCLGDLVRLMDRGLSPSLLFTELDSVPDPFAERLHQRLVNHPKYHETKNEVEALTQEILVFLSALNQTPDKGLAVVTEHFEAFRHAGLRLLSALSECGGIFLPIAAE